MHWPDACHGPSQARQRQGRALHCLDQSLNEGDGLVRGRTVPASQEGDPGEDPHPKAGGAVLGGSPSIHRTS